MTGRDAMELTRVKQELEKAAEDTQKSTLLEYDWQKIKDIEFQEMLRNKVAHMKRLRTDFQCTKCPDLNEHVSILVLQFLLILISFIIVCIGTCTQENFEPD